MGEAEVAGGGRGAGRPFNGAADILAALLSAARSESGFAFARSLAPALPRSFGGDNVPFHDFTTFVTRHLAPTSFAPEDAEARTDRRELLRDRSSGPSPSCACRVPAGSLSVASLPPSTPPSG